MNRTFKVKYTKNSNASRISFRGPGKATKSYVKKTINRLSETKFLYPNNNLTVSTAGTIDSLHNIAGGSNDDQREGNQVTLKYLKMNCILTNGDEDNLFRIVVFRHKAGARPTLSDMPLTNDVIMLDKDRFEVLYDKLFYLKESTNGASAIPGKIPFHIKLKLKNKVYFDNNAGNSSVRGGIFLYCRSDSVAAPNPSITYYGELRYKDL